MSSVDPAASRGAQWYDRGGEVWRHDGFTGASALRNISIVLWTETKELWDK